MGSQIENASWLIQLTIRSFAYQEDLRFGTKWTKQDIFRKKKTLDILNLAAKVLILLRRVATQFRIKEKWIKINKIENFTPIPNRFIQIHSLNLKSEVHSSGHFLFKFSQWKPPKSWSKWMRGTSYPIGRLWWPARRTCPGGRGCPRPPPLPLCFGGGVRNPHPPSI